MRIVIKNVDMQKTHNQKNGSYVPFYVTLDIKRTVFITDIYGQGLPTFARGCQ
jgi:hypothetical protein